MSFSWIQDSKMPNKSKKKKEKAEDFKKPRLKVGKKKSQPDNFTDTSFKSRAISLPNQSINEDKSKQLTNFRNLTLTDLLTQLKHYNSGVRKDSIAGMVDLFHRYPKLLTSSLGIIVNGILKILLDEDAEVRKTLLSFITEFFPGVMKSHISPFISLLVIYTCSAMTHIQEGIRFDAIKFMDVWLQISPEVVVDKFWERIMGNYLALLAVDSDLTNISRGHITTVDNGLLGTKGFGEPRNRFTSSQKAKVDILGSLARFLEASLGTLTADTHWFFLNFLSNRYARQAFISHFKSYHAIGSSQDLSVRWSDLLKTSAYSRHPRIQTIAPYLNQSPTSFTRINLFGGASSIRDGDIRNNSAIKEALPADVLTAEDINSRLTASRLKTLIISIQPTLLAFWLDTAPSVFNASGTIVMSNNLQTIHLVLKVMSILWRAAVGGLLIDSDKAWMDGYLQQQLKHFIIYFPFGHDHLGMRDSNVEYVLQDMNIVFCELTSLLLLTAAESEQMMVILGKSIPRSGSLQVETVVREHNGKKRPMQSDEPKDEKGISVWAEQIVEFIFNTLNYQKSNLKEKRQRISETASSSLVNDLRPNHLTALLPTLWGLLNCLDEKNQESIIDALINYYQQCHGQSASKKICLDFLSRILHIVPMPAYTGSFRIKVFSQIAKLMQSWVLTLPKLLWELKANNMETTKTILNLLTEISKGEMKSIFDSETFDALQKAMVPFFHVIVPNKGEIFGPFISLHEDLQCMAIEYVFYSQNLIGPMERALEKCVGNNQLPNTTREYIKEIIGRMKTS